MPAKYQPLLDWLLQHGEIIMGFMLAVLLAVFRTSKKYGKADWLEALICGALTLAAASLLEWMKFPSSLAIAIGGVIGFKGSHWTNAIIDRKLDIDEDKAP